MTTELIEFVSKLNIAIEQMDELMNLISESEDIEMEKIFAIYKNPVLCEPNITD